MFERRRALTRISLSSKRTFQKALSLLIHIYNTQQDQNCFQKLQLKIRPCNLAITSTSPKQGDAFSHKPKSSIFGIEIISSTNALNCLRHALG